MSLDSLDPGGIPAYLRKDAGVDSNAMDDSREGLNPNHAPRAVPWVSRKILCSQERAYFALDQNERPRGIKKRNPKNIRINPRDFPHPAKAGKKTIFVKIP
jgi:hypothetical protein